LEEMYLFLQLLRTSMFNFFLVWSEKRNHLDLNCTFNALKFEKSPISQHTVEIFFQANRTEHKLIHNVLIAARSIIWCRWRGPCAVAYARYNVFDALRLL
jgi:hypothetical protein